MPAAKPTIDRNGFDALIARSGLKLTEAQASELYGVYGWVEAMTVRVRAGGNRPREAEPALTFQPAKPAPRR